MCAGGRDLAGILGPVLLKLHASRRCVLPINSGLVVPFVTTDRRRRSVSAATPSYCGNGHPLTAANLAKSGSRWALPSVWRRARGPVSGSRRVSRI